MVCTSGAGGRLFRICAAGICLLDGNGVVWLGGNLNTQIPLVKYILKISHKGLLFGSYSDYQKALSDKVLDFRDRGKLMFKEIAEKLILEGYRGKTQSA